MKFYKNKAKVILYYFVIYLIAFVATGLFAAMVLGSDAIEHIIIIELIVVCVICSFIKPIIAETKQTVEVNEHEIICNNFIIGTNVVNGKIDYKFIESITLKRTLLKPFSCYLFVKLKNDKPFAILDDYLNYQELWSSFCNKCRCANPDAYIDEKIFKHLKR